jgi:hypothetical protein
VEKAFPLVVRFATQFSETMTKLSYFILCYRLLGGMPFTAIAMSSTLAPRIEVYTMLACSVHKPDIFRQNFPGFELGLQDISSPNLDIWGFSNEPSLTPLYLSDLVLEPENTNGSVPTTPRNRCASDPVVQAAVAKLTAGGFSICIIAIGAKAAWTSSFFCTVLFQ